MISEEDGGRETEIPERIGQEDRAIKQLNSLARSP